MARALTLKALTAAELLTEVLDKFGERWMLVGEDQWLSSSLTMASTAFVAKRRPVQG